MQAGSDPKAAGMIYFRSSMMVSFWIHSLCRAASRSLASAVRTMSLLRCSLTSMRGTSFGAGGMLTMSNCMREDIGRKCVLQEGNRWRMDPESSSQRAWQ